jgi:flagellar biosynthesis anti-sigma factor FlgM
MSITPPTPNSRPEGVAPATRPTPLRRSAESSPPATRDAAEVSTAARALAEAAKAVHDADEARAELILRLRQQIADGTYEPDEEAVARALLDRLQS